MSCFSIAILAGGLGTRIASIAGRLPKALIPINGTAFIAHQLKLLKVAGFTDVVLCVGYQSDALIDYVKDGSDFQLNVQYAFDGEKLLGTGSAIQAALPLLGDHFFVIYGDSYLQCDYAAIQKKYELSNRLGLMTIYKNNDQWDKSNVEYNGDNILYYNKKNKTESMNYIDYGLNIFSRKAFLPFKNKKSFDLSELQEYLVQKNQLAAYEVKQRFYEIGSIEGIAELEKKLNCNINFI